MTFQIKINNIDRTADILTDNFDIEQILTKEVDTARLLVKPNGWKPEVGQEIVIYDDGVKIFAGVILRITEEAIAFITQYALECTDYTHLMDGKQITKSYENKTVNEIISDIKTYFLPPEFTINNVNCAKKVNYIAFNYEFLSKCFQQLAELFNYDWYVDYDKDIHFFSKEANVAPFNLEDDTNKYIYNSLEIVRDTSQLRNSIIVRGGEYQGNLYTEKQIADGAQTTFNLAYKYANIGVKVNGVSKTVGADYLSNPEDYDCLYNFEMKVIIFREDNKPLEGQEVEISGNPYARVIVKIKDNISIAKYGEYQFSIYDESINSKEGARDRARAELTAYTEKISEGRFKTYEPGLKVGQKIKVISEKRGIDEEFIINRLQISLLTTSQLEYNVSLITTRTFDAIEMLQKLIEKEKKQIVIKGDEVLETIEDINENCEIQEEVETRAGKNIIDDLGIQELVRKDPWYPVCVWASYTPTGNDDLKRPLWWDRGWWE